MVISTVGIELIKEFEGCYLEAYRCPAGVWTIGYGTTEPINGKPITAGMTITQQQADELLLQNLKIYEKAVNENVKVPLSQNQYDALVSFTYNVGCGALSTSTLLKMLNNNDYLGAADQFLRWDKAGGKVLAGLTRRRKRERELFLKDVSAATPKNDKDLEDAVNKIIKSGISLTYNCWNNINNMQLTNVPALLDRLGGVDALVTRGIISSPEIWLNGVYTKQNVRSLLIKFSFKL